MATDPELMRVEDSVKEKFLELVRHLSLLELKKFQKHEYAEMVFQDMSKLLPNIDKDQLKTTSHYVSNALENERRRELGARSRKGNPSQDSNALLSSTVIEDLDETMHLDEGTINNTEDSDSAVRQSTETLDDSVTMIKQTISFENKTDNGHKTSTQTDQKSAKCCDSCKINQKHRKKVDMIQCCFCMTWFHQQCVGIQKDDPIGIWLCLRCRSVPTSVQNEINNLRSDVTQLKTTAELILSSMNNLTTKLENSIGGINDRLTALTRQINLHDITTNEAIENISSKMTGIKTSLDQKTNLIQNKTTAVLEKIKTFDANVKNDISSTATETQTQNARNQITCQKQITNSNRGKSRPEQTQRKHKIKHHENQKSKPQTQNRNRNNDSTNEDECIDLTKSVPERNTINQSTLLIGSSILKNIKTSDLNENTAVRTVPGATIHTIKNKLLDLNIDKCETVTLHVGGNDADQGDDLDTFRENFEELLDIVADGSRNVIVSELLPRETVDLKPFNETLKSLCADNAVEFVENYDSFLLANGQLVDSLYLKDKLHINAAGTGKLLNHINELHQIVRTQQVNVTYHRNRPVYHRNPSNGYRKRPGTHKPKRFCHICYTSGSHNTNECWYNGRNDRRSDRIPY